VSLPASHLSAEAIAASADGLLGRGAKARADRHLAACAECRAAVREQREAVFALRTAPAPQPPGDLLDRLRNLPATTPLCTPPIALDPQGRPQFPAYGTSMEAMQSAAQPSRAGRVARTGTLGLVAAAAAVLTAGTVAAGAAAALDSTPVPGSGAAVTPSPSRGPAPAQMMFVRPAVDSGPGPLGR
jgi:anti-sigma factor RsiW